MNQRPKHIRPINLRGISNDEFLQEAVDAMLQAITDNKSWLAHNLTIFVCAYSEAVDRSQSQYKPTGQFRCRACSTIWSGEYLFEDPSFLQRWTCGNLFCGGTVDEVQPDPKVTYMKINFVGGFMDGDSCDYSLETPLFVALPRDHKPVIRK